MGKSVGVNKLSVVHKGGNGKTIVFPDVCKTPSPVLQPPVMGMGKDKDKSVCLVCEKEL